MLHMRSKKEVPNCLTSLLQRVPYSVSSQPKQDRPLHIDLHGPPVRTVRPAPLEGGEEGLNATFTALSCFTRSSETARSPDTIVSWMLRSSSAERLLFPPLSPTLLFSPQYYQGDSLMVFDALCRFHG